MIISFSSIKNKYQKGNKIKVMFSFLAYYYQLGIGISFSRSQSDTIKRRTLSWYVNSKCYSIYPTVRKPTKAVKAIFETKSNICTWKEKESTISREGGMLDKSYFNNCFLLSATCQIRSFILLKHNIGRTKSWPRIMFCNCYVQLN